MNKRSVSFFVAQSGHPMVALLTLVTFLTSSMVPAWAMNSARGGALPQPLPLFPPDNWWNLDISNWPVDANSANFISFINNGGTHAVYIRTSAATREPEMISTACRTRS